MAGQPMGGAGGAAPATGGKGGGNAFQQASQAMTGAYGGAANAMMYQPMMIDYTAAGGGGAQAMQLDPSSTAYQAAQFQQSDLDRFMNPYTSQVVDQSLADIERAQATAAGAFGGSRGALMEAEIARNALEQGASTAAGLRRQGFEFASQMGQQDVARRQQALQQNAQQQLQAMLANQASALSASQTNAQLGTQASLANQQAALQAALANQAAGLQGSQQSLQAALGLGNLANLGFGMGQDVLSGMQQQGLMQQMLQQSLFDKAAGQYAGYQGQPSTALGYLAQALGATQVPQNQSTSSNPGLFGWASMLLGSDVRLKKNIRRVGKTPGGHNLYAWDWKKQAKSVFGKTGSDMGVLAQEVMETRPDLVVQFPDGYYRVNYGGIS
jgi:hypothetical protein